MNSVAPVRGMSDVPPEAAVLWRGAEGAAADVLQLYGYAEVRTPVVERAELFSRPLGQYSEVVEKEMYAFQDRSGENLALRPEATASIVRALAQSPAVRNGVARVWQTGPMFRRERPQKGRHRQFHQLDAEALGAQSPAIDAEQIVMLRRLWEALGVGGKLALQINNLGNPDERARHREKLSQYLQRRADELDDAARQRVATNPLRILDSKEPKTLAVVAEAPALADELGGESRKHVDAVCEKISAAGVSFAQNPLLVRGLDYYNLTVYEWALADDERRQNVVCGGGRYDGLAETIGLPPTPGCGFALGMERLIDLMRECGFRSASAAPACRMVADDCAESFAESAAERLRDCGVSVARQMTGGNFSRQMKKAAAAESPVLAIVGESELRAGRIVFKRLADGRRAEADLEGAGAAALELLGGEGGEGVEGVEGGGDFLKTKSH